MKAEMADPENTSIARQRHGNTFFVVMNNHATTEEFLQAVFSMRSVLRLYKENQREFMYISAFRIRKII
jgi:hypothetical protein